MRPAVLYLLLASLYLVYAPHAEFVLDDWPVLARYEEARRAGAAEQLHIARLLVQNQFHNQFRFQFLSFNFAYLLFLLVGYSPAVVFVVFLLLHAGCAMALRRAAVKLGLGEWAGFLAGTIFLLSPLAHGPLFWSHNCSYYLWCTFWFLLYLGSLAESLTTGRLDARAAARQSGFLLLALFSGDPIFVLLLAGAPLTAWFLRSKLWARATLLAWGVVGTAAVFYALVINRTPIVSGGVGLRYEFSLLNLRANLAGILGTYRNLSGLEAGSYFHLRPTAAALAAAALAVAATLWWLRRADARGAPLLRAAAYAAALWAAAYGPIWFIRSHEFRYDYVPSAYLALGLGAALPAAPVARLALAAMAVGWAAWASMADIEQCWKRQSANLRTFGTRLRELAPHQPGDLIIVSGTPLYIGTAPHFIFQAGWASSAYAQHVTGVPGLEAAREIVNEGGKLRVYHRNYMRDLKPEEPARTRILVEQRDGSLAEQRLLAQEVRPGMYRLYALKGYTGPSIAPTEYRRDQIGMVEGDVYFARPFSGHGPVDW